MSLALDGFVSAAVGYGNSSKTVSLTTSNSADVIVVIAGAENRSSSTVSSLVSSIGASGLTFTKRLQQYGRNTGGSLGPSASSIEIWYAVAGSPLSSESIDVTFAAAVDCGVVIAFGVSGADTTTPFDPNGSLPAFADTGDTVSISTSNATDFLIFVSGLGGTASGGPLGAASLSPDTWTSIATQTDNSGFENMEMAVSYQIVSSTQSSVAFGGTPGSTWPNNAVDAVQAVSATTVDLPGVTATAGVGNLRLGITSEIALAGVFATAIAGSSGVPYGVGPYGGGSYGGTAQELVLIEPRDLGVHATAEVGRFTIESNHLLHFLEGVSATSEVGAFSRKTVAELTGVQATTAVGSFQVVYVLSTFGPSLPWVPLLGAPLLGDVFQFSSVDPPGPTVTYPTDIAQVYNPLLGAFDWEIVDQQLLTNQDLVTSIVVSLFTDRLAAPTDRIPDLTTNRRGWWGDPFLQADPTVGQRIGSRLWLLSRASSSAETLLVAQGYVTESLAWLTTKGVASSFTVNTFWLDANTNTADGTIGGQKLGMQVTIYRQGQPPASITFAWAWQQLSVGTPTQ